VFIYAYFADYRDIKYYALLIFIVAGLSDILDGYLARKFEAQSKLGKLLDPLGDKMMMFTVMVCITITRPILIWAVLVYFVKEVLMGIGGYILHKKGGEIPPANFLGKCSTILFYIVCAALMFFRNIPDTVAIALISAAICLALVALAGYLHTYIKMVKSMSK
jgi:CDP-diacylglycerol--glycerol-3-phosphate 3-phosphatidyltransferase